MVGKGEGEGEGGGEEQLFAHPITGMPAVQGISNWKLQDLHEIWRWSGNLR